MKKTLSWLMPLKCNMPSLKLLVNKKPVNEEPDTIQRCRTQFRIHRFPTLISLNCHSKRRNLRQISTFKNYLVNSIPDKSRANKHAMSYSIDNKLLIDNRKVKNDMLCYNNVKKSYQQIFNRVLKRNDRAREHRVVKSYTSVRF